MSVFLSAPVSAFHSLMVFDPTMLAPIPPLGENRTARTISSALIVCLRAPDCASHSLTVSSRLPLPIVLPSAVKATDITVSASPVTVSFSETPWACHSFRDLSKLPLANFEPSGEKATQVTSPVCPLNFCFDSPVCASHSLIRFSNVSTVTIVWPSGEKARGELVFSNVNFSAPVCTSRSFTPLLPSSALAIVLLSGEKTTDVTLSELRPSVFFKAPLCSSASSSFPLPSFQP